MRRSLCLAVLSLSLTFSLTHCGGTRANPIPTAPAQPPVVIPPPPPPPPPPPLSSDPCTMPTVPTAADHIFPSADFTENVFVEVGNVDPNQYWQFRVDGSGVVQKIAETPNYFDPSIVMDGGRVIGFRKEGTYPTQFALNRIAPNGTLTEIASVPAATDTAYGRFLYHVEFGGVSVYRLAEGETLQFVGGTPYPVHGQWVQAALVTREQLYVWIMTGYDPPYTESTWDHIVVFDRDAVTGMVNVVADSRDLLYQFSMRGSLDGTYMLGNGLLRWNPATRGWDQGPSIPGIPRSLHPSNRFLFALSNCGEKLKTALYRKNEDESLVPLGTREGVYVFDSSGHFAITSTPEQPFLEFYRFDPVTGDIARTPAASFPLPRFNRIDDVESVVSGRDVTNTTVIWW